MIMKMIMYLANKTKITKIKNKMNKLKANYKI